MMSEDAVKACNCIEKITEMLSEQYGGKGYIQEYEHFSKRLVSTFVYRKGRKVNQVYVHFTHCPWCGKEYPLMEPCGKKDGDSDE